MAQKPKRSEIRIVSGKQSESEPKESGKTMNNKIITAPDVRPKPKSSATVEGEKTMKKLFTSTLLTVAAVPFLMAAPNAAKKVQNTASTTSTKAPVKKSHKKSVKKTTATAPAAVAPKQ